MMSVYPVSEGFSLSWWLVHCLHTLCHTWFAQSQWWFLHGGDSVYTKAALFGIWAFCTPIRVERKEKENTIALAVTQQYISQPPLFMQKPIQVYVLLCLSLAQQRLRLQPCESLYLEAVVLQIREKSFRRSSSSAFWVTSPSDAVPGEAVPCCFILPGAQGKMPRNPA